MEHDARENAEELRRRVDELTRSLAEHQQTVARLAETEQRLSRFVDASPDVIAISEQGILVEVNARVEDLMGYQAHEMIGRSALDFAAPEDRHIVIDHVRSGSEVTYEHHILRKDGSRFFAEVRGRKVPYQGRSVRVSIIRDITDRRRAEEATRVALVQREALLAQQAMVAQLSTPLLPITDDTLILPLIGAVSPERASAVIEVLSRGVAERRARVAILDITGVPDVDEQVADALLRATRAVRLLGARAILTGIRPEVAQHIVRAGMDLTGITTCGTLQQGVADALRRR
ncbi:PAS domain S-box protein [Sorangium sp. So ce327]|jgi:PAS domain S-box-containing protein|uniref:PAS domain S-box protein n=1 Tax=unclassified Sorangium TaxID=2621164 RepID=UPI003F63BDEB